MATEPWLVRFSSGSNWRGETHRVCDRPDAIGQLQRHVLLPAAQERRRQPGTQDIKILIEDDPPSLRVTNEVVPVDLPQRRQQSLVDEQAAALDAKQSALEESRRLSATARSAP